jgi:hypothetical protein
MMMTTTTMMRRRMRIVRAPTMAMVMIMFCCLIVFCCCWWWCCCCCCFIGRECSVTCSPLSLQFHSFDFIFHHHLYYFASLGDVITTVPEAEYHLRFRLRFVLYRVQGTICGHSWTTVWPSPLPARVWGKRRCWCMTSARWGWRGTTRRTQFCVVASRVMCSEGRDRNTRKWVQSAK